MNGLCAYALGLGLRPLMAGSRLESAWRYPGGLTLEFSGGGVPFLDILLLGPRVELVPSTAPAVAARTGEPVFAAAAGSRIADIRPAGLDRVLLLALDDGVMWSESDPLVLRVDLTGAFRAASLFRGEEARPLETFGTAGSRIPRRAGDLPTPKPVSLLDAERRWPIGLFDEPAARQTGGAAA
ncbi:MAG: hypothetical protein PHQ19_06080, partial [Candidatus Krumholzibacteria bacterium]|nr:hypothetical protein [Candidatus Krumholzibacteria bacterium]